MTPSNSVAKFLGKLDIARIAQDKQRAEFKITKKRMTYAERKAAGMLRAK